MSEEKLYIDDGELVYYINKNEFVACDEIPMPMLEGIKDLQQKVEQLEKELQTTANNCKQLENIRKEAIDYVYKHIQEYDADGTFTNLDEFDFIASPQVLLNILNKGGEE